jgi:TctA family transporter
VLGYVLRKLKYPLAPLVLALVLGDRAEDAFRQSMLLSQGDLSIFVSKPLVGALTISAIAILVLPPLLTMRRRTRTAATGPA